MTASDQTMREDEVRAAVERYVEGVRRNGPEAVERAFTDDAAIRGYLGPDWVTRSGADFAAEVVATAPPADPAYRYGIHGIGVYDNIVRVVLDEDAYLG